MKTKSIDRQSPSVRAVCFTHSITAMNFDTSTITIKNNKITAIQNMLDNEEVTIQDEPNLIRKIYKPKQTL